MVSEDRNEFNDAETIRELRRANAQLASQLVKAKVRKEELVAAVYDGAFAASSGLDWPPIIAPAPDRRRHGAEVAIVMLSDWQLAKRTATYNTQVCEKRIELLATKVAALTAIQRKDHPVRELHVFVTGDIVEGELIFPGQAHSIDASLFMQVTVDGPRILVNFLRKMLTIFDKVVVKFVIGNHGSIGGLFRREMHPESNADAMLYEITKRTLEPHEKRIHFGRTYIPGEAAWWETDTISGKLHNHTWLMAHGNQIKGYNGFPWYGFGKKLLGWRTSHMLPDFDYASTAHFHTPVRMFLNDLTCWGNGTTESHNPYALETLAASGEPCQWLIFINPERPSGQGVTAEYLVHLSDA